MGNILLHLLGLLAVFCETSGIRSYDCSGPHLNVTTYSLLSVGECAVPDVEPEKKEVHVQLLQYSEYGSTEVIQCKVEIDRTVQYCGMHSHVSAVRGGKRQYLINLSAETCRRMQTIGALDLGGNAQITGLRKNSTDSRSITLAGRISNDGSCSGTQYSDAYGTWDNVIVQANVKIVLRNYQADVRYSSNSVILRSGLHCKYNEGTCADIDDGDAFWVQEPPDNCHFYDYDVLYEGIATKLRMKNDNTQPEIYTVVTHDTTFALTRTTNFSLCGYIIARTEHPKLFIIEVAPGRGFVSRKRTSVNNLDIFTYVNSKFIYVEKHIRTQMTRLYRDIIMQKCALEKQVIMTALALADISPREMAYIIMRGPGYMAVPAKEAVYIIKCTPVDVTIRQDKHCYHDIPVYFRNESWFISPKSHVLLKTSTIKPCNDLFPDMIKIQDNWYTFTPATKKTLSPPEIQPLTQHKWHYIDADTLATSGIYTQEDLDRLRDHIMFPAEKTALLNTIARGAMGQPVSTGQFPFYKLLDEEAIDKIANSAGAKLWSSFLTFGSASAGFIGLFIIARIIKLCVDTIIHGYAIHALYGWSFRLIGAIWSSVTHLLIAIGKRSSKENSTATPQDQVQHPVSPGTPTAPATPEPLRRSMYPRVINENLNLSDYEAYMAKRNNGTTNV